MFLQLNEQFSSDSHPNENCKSSTGFALQWATVWSPLNQGLTILATNSCKILVTFLWRCFFVSTGKVFFFLSQKDVCSSFFARTGRYVYVWVCWSQKKRLKMNTRHLGLFVMLNGLNNLMPSSWLSESHLLYFLCWSEKTIVDVRWTKNSLFWTVLWCFRRH